MNYERTSRARIKGMLRQMFLRSKERNQCLQRDKYTCRLCLKKQTAKKGQEFKVECHHLKGINIWDNVIDLIQEQLLCNPDDLLTLCRDCHDNETNKQQ
jgi:5-methylcytosine-specific restriction endonuclease McrA